MVYEERLRRLGLHSLRQKRLKGDGLTDVINHLKGILAKIDPGSFQRGRV